MRKAVAAILIMLLLVPAVAGATITCGNHVTAPGLKLKCTLAGTGNESFRLYLKSLNGVGMDSSNIEATGHTFGWNQTVRVNPGGAYLVAPFNFTVDLKSAMREFAGRTWLGSNHYWILYNKENVLTFEILGENGTVEEKNVTVYISGRVPYPWENGVLSGAFLALILVTGVFILFRFASKSMESETEKESPETSGEDRPKPPQPSRAGFAVTGAFLFRGGGLFVVSWLFYFLTTPLRIVSDVGLYILTVVLAFLTLEWLLFVWDAWRSGHPYIIREAPLTGLEWVPLAVVPLGGWPLDFKLVPFGVLSFFLLFFLNRESRINVLMRKLALPASLVAAFALVLLLNPDVAFGVIFLAMAFLHSYLVVSKIETAPSIEDLPVFQRSPEVKELLERFDDVIKRRKLEGDE
ncbi:hypothetical protein [Thermococcus sp.]|uniref:hypothetical protein n=1 Tax=Thermococcus sp. TaxID=35749 RepID=UPI00263213DE|nr:hypothetical protein [Thermococcus sp.]